MLVIDEAFDHWQKPKNPEDYHRFFDEWWERDISSMVMRDRNHPSIILWSVGNEIQERADPPGLEITKKLKAKVQQLDSTRLVTAAMCEFWDNPGRQWDFTAPAFALLDVGGYNYQWGNYEPDHKLFPNRIMAGTESVPQHAYENWQMVEKHPYVIGDFVWTAIDYLGESGIGHSTTDTGKMEFSNPWPWFNAYCGDIDIIGNKKPQSYYRDVVWGKSPIELAVHAPLPEGAKEQVSYWGWPNEQQSWTWPGNEGKMMEVSVYSRSPVVRLELNGKFIGEKTISDSARLTAKFSLPYKPGQLKATALKDGQPVGSVLLATRNAPTHIHLIADRSKIKASRSDLSYVSIEIVDDQDRIVPNAEIPVQFSVSGDGEIAAVGSGNPADMSSFKGTSKKTWRGKCLVILRPTGKEGKIVLKAEAAGLGEGEVVVETDGR
jgi:beta-galactosidase